MKDMIDTDSGGYWYGGGELAQQRWPLARDSNRFCPYVAGDVLKNDMGFMLNSFIDEQLLEGGKRSTIGYGTLLVMFE
uniref:Uncharacterized protein n=1 Tax=Parascaris equorum TaxID=6256 RepID=A0A914RZS2_PAREQ